MKKRKGKGKMDKKQEEILEQNVNPEEETAENIPESETSPEAPVEEAKAEEEDPVQKALDEANAKTAEYLQLGTGGCLRGRTQGRGRGDAAGAGQS